MSIFSIFWVLACLASESERAFSKAVRQNSPELVLCCCSGFIGERRPEGGVHMGEYTGQVQVGSGLDQVVARRYFRAAQDWSSERSYSDVRATARLNLIKSSRRS